ncbi:unnamed protein product [Choristocarpus tenellus]
MTKGQPLDFDIINDNAFHVYYVPIHLAFNGVLTQMRLHPGLEVEAIEGKTSGSRSPTRGDFFEIDWIRLVRAPHIKRVQGCLDAAFPEPGPELGMSFAVSNVTDRDKIVNDFLRVRRTNFGRVEGMPYYTSHNCLRNGGQLISVGGAAFGTDQAYVDVGGVPCLDVQHVPGREETELTCQLPPAMFVGRLGGVEKRAPFGTGGVVEVRVSSGTMLGLQHSVTYLSYQVPPPQPTRPNVSNIAAGSIDVSWEPPEDYWEAMAITGYQVGWLSVISNNTESPSEGNNTMVGEIMAKEMSTVGNITTTTVRGLTPGLGYIFWVRAMAENQSDQRWEQVDLYGRREQLEGGVVSPFSLPTNVTTTLQADLVFDRFNANSTLNHSASDSRATLGPRGQWAGEGHYGIQLVGSAQVENCNRSAACCDGFSPSDEGDTYVCGEGGHGSPFACAALATPGKEAGLERLRSDLNPPRSGPPQEGSFPSSAIVVSHTDLSQWGVQVAHSCGPALRLTSNRPFSTGAAWYPRPMTVGEGFDTTFTFRLSSPSLRCNIMDGVHTTCRSRGADGLAFVIQGEGPLALGDGGMGLGYSGIDNSLAIEFDTYYNAELVEPYENHISVHTRGWRNRGSSNQSYSLGSTSDVPNLTDGPRVARIVYSPRLDSSDIFSGHFLTTGHTGYFLENAAYSAGGMPDWGVGIGLMSVYVDDLSEPTMTIPLNLEATLKLNHGTAYVGFTASTGIDTYQVHDLLEWKFTSSREEIPYSPSPLVNGQGAYASCDGQDDCVHP